MKVIHLISGGDTGGARTHVHLLLKYLNRQIEATLVCFTDGPFAQDARAMGIPVVVLDQGLPGALKELRAMIRSGGYDVIHCHGSRGNLMGALLKRSCQVPLISTVHSDPKLDYMGRPAARLIYGTLNALSLRRMDYHIGVSDSMRELLISRGFHPGRIYTIYNGIEFPEEAPRDEAARLAARDAFFQRVGLQADRDSVVVGIGARLHPVKDLPTLLRGFALAYARYPQLRLLIAGDGQELDNLRTLARELGIDGVTCFAGWLSDMQEFYRAIDINTLTSLSETFPYALTEGAREHLPTVSSRVGGVPKLIIPGETGLLFTPGDYEALGGHLALLAGSPEERKRLGEALYQKASREFSAQASCDKQLRIYESVVKNHRAQKEKRPYGVLICGAYGMSNAGDEAILDAVVAEMRAIDPDMPLTVLSRTPKATALRHGVDSLHMFHLWGFHRVMKRSELYINGGGSLIQDVTSSRSLWYYLYTIAAAKRRGCRVLMYGCGIGPVSRPRNRRLAARVLNKHVDAITLREENSLEELRDFGVTQPEIILASDPALTLPGAPRGEVDAKMRELGLEPAGQYLCFCLRKWTGFDKKAACFAAAADAAYEKYGLTPVFLAVNTKSDAAAAQLAAGYMRAPAIIVDEPLPTAMTIGLIARMRAVVSIRLHGLIFAASQAVPIAGVVYDPKVSAFLDYIGQTNYLPLEAVTDESLTALIDAALAADSGALAAATARLKDIESRNTQTARRLLGRETEPSS